MTESDCVRLSPILQRFQILNCVRAKTTFFGGSYAAYDFAKKVRTASPNSSMISTRTLRTTRPKRVRTSTLFGSQSYARTTPIERVRTGDGGWQTAVHPMTDRGFAPCPKSLSR
jgi:hypothetical protein